MSIITKKSEEFLFKYLNNAAPTGYEAPGQKLWLEYIRDYIEEYEIDTYGTVYGVINPGQDYEVLELGVHVGCVVTYPDELILLNDRYYCGRALDNKMGGFCIAEVARLLKKNKVKLPYSLYIVNSVQEEVGLRGAEMIANRICPDVAIVTDVTHDTHTPMLSPKELGDIKTGAGPTITYAPAVHNILQELIIDAAKKKKIPLQREAVSRHTGTDTEAFAYSQQGVASALISLPIRYMHTTVEMAHREDVENLIQLIYETLRKIKKNHNFKYLNI